MNKKITTFLCAVLMLAQALVLVTQVKAEVAKSEDTSTSSEVYFEDLSPSAFDRYSGNEGDSFINKVGTRNSATGINGINYTHGLEIWVARWNYKNEKSWVWNEYDLSGTAVSLVGEITVSNGSYNKTNFDTTLEIIGDGVTLFKMVMLPNMQTQDINIDIKGINKLRISVYDNEAKSGGTSFIFGNARVSGMSNPSLPAIPDDAVEFNGHYYKLYDHADKWTDAENYCHSLGGYLTTITSKKEQDFIYNYLLNSAAEKNYFLGGKKVNENWTWANGETWSYSNWCPREPDGSGDFLQIFAKPNDTRYLFGTWDDTTNSKSNNGYICEWGTVETEIDLGDLNGDGKINTADAVAILKAAAEITQLDETQMLAADVNRDDKVNTADAVTILKYAAGIITEF
ncbi:MAG: NPCBM/NEW2 domain-containing protein [Clostridia bacterium]|nr:NPCBM/NEW2 domain-containing protein [Clostridia bacterium]